MAPSAIQDISYDPSISPTMSSTNGPSPWRKVVPMEEAQAIIVGKQQHCFGRNLHSTVPMIKYGKGIHLYTDSGRQIWDMAGGAAVTALGYGNERVLTAQAKQAETGISYLASAFWTSQVVEDACEELIYSTNNQMSLVYLIGSGSEAMEAAMKMARQFYLENDKNTSRSLFISREHSYHGNTLGALSISGHVARREPYHPMLLSNIHFVSSCNPYRQQLEGESNTQFVARKAAELDAKFQELGPENVAAFVAEPVSGAALGCVPASPGYLRAMKAVCQKYGALFILDEVMSGMGRCGTTHVWQAEGVIPDIQTIGKGIAAGYSNCAAVLAGPQVAQRFREGSGQFVHGQTYQAMPAQAVAVLEVQRIIREDDLIANVLQQGSRLARGLKRLLGDHPNVGDIRGRGLFWGIEFVKNRITKEPFELQVGVATRMQQTAISEPYNMTVYSGTGTADGYRGDHIIIAPPYIVTADDIDHVVQTVAAVVKLVFQQINKN